MSPIVNERAGEAPVGAQMFRVPCLRTREQVHLLETHPHGEILSLPSTHGVDIHIPSRLPARFLECPAVMCHSTRESSSVRKVQC
jgi:hypothetical protein